MVLGLNLRYTSRPVAEALRSMKAKWGEDLLDKGEQAEHASHATTMVNGKQISKRTLVKEKDEILIGKFKSSVM